MGSLTNAYGTSKMLDVEKVMMYPNGYININQNGEYTKHYYAEEARIASKIGTGLGLLGFDTISYFVPGNEWSIGYIVTAIVPKYSNTLTVSSNTDTTFNRVAKQELGLLTGDTIYLVNYSLAAITSFAADSTVYEEGLYFYHGNHLSSTQLITDITGDIAQAILYAPFGQIISEYRADWMLDTIPRFLFTGQERDEESGMDYMNARYYSSDNMSFTSRDPLFEKYFWISGYCYAMNNPVKYFDPTGMEVETTQEGASLIQKTVSEDDAKFIRLDENGRIDKNLLNQCENNEGNIGKLKEIVNSESVVNFGISDKFEYQTENGAQEQNMLEIIVDFSYGGVYELSTGEKGHQGQTQYPNGKIGTWGASTNEKTNVIINKNLSLQGKAEATGHELYGHAYLNVKGLDGSHNIKGTQDTNLLLKTNIISSMKEIQNYFKK
jgi:RHS repeat-associated protein